MAVPVSIEDYVKACFDPRPSAASRSSRLILHFYVKKMEEEQIREIEKAAASTAADHGLEVKSDESSDLQDLPFSLLPHLLSLLLGAGNGPSPSLHHKKWWRSPIFSVALIHRQRSLPAGRLSAAPPPGLP